MMFTQVLSTELALILIHVRKIFNCMVASKMLLSMGLATVDKELSTQLWSSYLQNGTLKNQHNSDGSRSHLSVLSYR